MKKLQKPKLNKYIQKYYHKSCFKINQYQNMKLKYQGNSMRPLDLVLWRISQKTCSPDKKNAMVDYELR